MTPVGARCRHFRKAAGLTQRQVGDKAEVSHVLISQLERDRIRKPTLDLLERVAAACGVTIFQLIGDQPPANDAGSAAPADPVPQD